MNIVESYKEAEAQDLKERGLLIALTVPLGKNDPALKVWKRHLKSIGAPYLIIQNGAGNIILKERKDFRCRHCGHFLNIRPPKKRAHLTHKQFGIACPGQSR